MPFPAVTDASILIGLDNIDLLDSLARLFDRLALPPRLLNSAVLLPAHLRDISPNASISVDISLWRQGAMDSLRRMKGSQMRLHVTRIFSCVAIVAILSFGLSGVAAQEKASPTPGKAQATLAGNALSLLPDTNNGVVEVIAVGEKNGAEIPVVVRNNSTEAVAGVVVKVEARDPAGKLIGVGESLSNHAPKPYLLNPGELDLGFVSIDGDIQADAVYTFSVQSEPSPGKFVSFSIDVNFGEVNWLSDRIVGEIINPSDQPLTSHILC